MENKQNELTDDLFNEMAGLLPMDCDYVHEFTPAIYFRFPEKVRPVFRLRQFNNKQVTQIKSIMYKVMTNTDKNGVRIQPTMTEIEKMNNSYMRILHKVFDGWRNLYDVRTKMLVEYDGEFDSLMNLPEGIRTALLEEATRITGFNLEA